MKVLIISSEELNAENQLSSVFELAQAKALHRCGVEVAIISVGYLAVKDVVKSLISKRGLNYRVCNKSFSNKLRLLVSTFFKSLTSKVQVRKWRIDGINVYESLQHRFAYNMHENAHQQWVQTGFSAYQKYSAEQGRPDVVHAHSRFLLAGLLAVEIKQKTQIPFVLTEHSSFYSRNLIRDFQVPLIKNAIEQSADFYVVSSSFGKLINKKLEANYNYQVLPNVLDETFETVQLKQGGGEPFVIVNVANLEPVKNQHLLLDAFHLLVKEVPAAQLRIVGSGHLKNVLEQKANELGIRKNIVFTGQLDQDAVKQEIENAALLVLSSRSETFGAVLIEALACGKPVVSTRSGGPEEIINSSNGILVEHTAQALADAMIYVRNHLKSFDPEQIRKDCLKKYSGAVIAKQLMSAYEKIIQKEPSFSVA
ncbi:MAG: glycosyltransferase [Flavisolibacter sp.]